MQHINIRMRRVLDVTTHPKGDKVSAPVRLKLHKPVPVTLTARPMDIEAQEVLARVKHLGLSADDGNAGRVSFDIHAGFVFDGASVPRGTDWFAHRYGLSLPAALLHDFLCVHAHKAFDPALRKAADVIFFNHLKYLGVKPWRARVMYYAVRAAGIWAHRGQ